MFVDTRTMPEVDSIEGDICIVGAGAAGITLALEFAGRSTQVVVLEGGGFEIDADSQALYEGEVVGLPYFPLDVTRLRYLGGTTNHWGGQCAPLRGFDFETRPWLTRSGWPIGLADVAPHYARAAKILELSELGWDVAAWEQETGHSRWPLDPALFETRIFQVQQQRMGQAHREALAAAANVRVHLHANLLELETNETASVVTAARVTTVEGRALSVKAKLFVLAAGGIENPRLLLLSDRVQSEGLGNGHDLVGRFFMEHAHLVAATITPADPWVPVWFYQRHFRDQADVDPFVQLSPEVEAEEQLESILVSLDPVGRSVPGYWSLRRFGRELLGGQFDDLGHHVGTIVGDLDKLTVLAYDYLRHGQYPVERIDCVVGMTPVPNPDSRITLAEARDALGLRRVRLDWRLSEIDLRSLRRTVELLGAEVGRLGIGRLRSNLDPDDAWVERVEGGHHHAGTTRMAATPAEGVVDVDCKVHGIDNLYVAGSSVFPESGAFTPTFLIIALAIRLADHLHERLA